MAKRNSHCSFCGATFATDAPWPRRCAACDNTSFLNPLPVAVLVQPVSGGGLLMIRRGIPPIGKLALPGGFIDLGESWTAAAARELREETGIAIDAATIREYRVLSAPPPDTTLLVFGIAPEIDASTWPPFEKTSETMERVVIQAPHEDIGFPLHAQVVKEYFAGRRG